MRLPRRIIALVVFTLACGGSEVAAPPRDEVVRLSDSAEVITVFDDILPVLLSSQPDSLGAVLALGELELAGNTGDSLALTLRATGIVRRALASGSSIMIDDGFGLTIIDPESIMRSRIVYRLRHSSARVRLMLSRGASRAIIDSLQGQAVRAAAPSLEAQFSGSIVTSRMKWSRSARTGGEAALTTNACEATEGAGTCDGVSYAIDPYVDAGVYFQSSPGTQPSVDITVTFTGPVNSVSVTIGDPTYSGNTATAYDAAGNILTATEFTHSGVWGVNNPDTRVLMVPDSLSIARMVLHAAADDYVYYYMSINMSPPQGPGTVGCTAASPTPFVRGTDIVCTARGFAGDLSWKFVSHNRLHVVERAATRDTVWSGKIALSGQVTVYGYFGPLLDSASTSVLVKKRDWSRDSLRRTLTILTAAEWRSQPRTPGDPTDLRVRPTQFDGQFGAASGRLAWRDPVQLYPPYTDSIQSGPNAGVMYLTEFPWKSDHKVAYNDDALKKYSDFWNLQANLASGGNCGKADVEGIIPEVKQHEGFAFDRNSHTWIFWDRAQRELRTKAEAIAGLRLEDDAVGGYTKQLTQVLSDVDDIAHNDSQSMDTDSGRNVLTNICTYRFFPS